jgi:hypothetical protein
MRILMQRPASPFVISNAVRHVAPSIGSHLPGGPAEYRQASAGAVCVSSYTQIVLFWIIQTTQLGPTVQRHFGCEAAWQ